MAALQDKFYVVICRDGNPGEVVTLDALAEVLELLRTEYDKGTPEDELQLMVFHGRLWPVTQGPNAYLLTPSGQGCYPIKVLAIPCANPERLAEVLRGHVRPPSGPDPDYAATTTPPSAGDLPVS